MLGLARRYGEGPVLMGTLADQERLSRKYLHALLASLKAAELVKSVRGAGGGFELSRAPWEIRLDEILRAAEGPLSLVDCVATASKCDRSSICTARRVWQTLSARIEEVLHDVSLQDLLAMETPGFDADAAPLTRTVPGSGLTASAPPKKRRTRNRRSGKQSA